MHEIISLNSPIKKIVLSFIFLCLIWNFFIPVFETPDESGHYGYVKFILTNKSLPQPPYPWDSGGSLYHPPLYYLLLAPVLKTALAPDYEQNLTVNKKWKESRFLAANAFIHSKDELSFRWNKKIIWFHLLRLSSTIFATFTVIAIYFTARIFFRNENFALLSTVLVAFNPQFIFHSSAITNDSLAALLGTLVILILVFRLRQKFIDFRYDFILGLLLGMSLITKLNLFFLIPTVIIGYILAFKVIIKSYAKRILLLVSGVLIAAGWYFARNLSLYGEPFGISAQTQMFSIFANKNTGYHLLNDVLLFFISSLQTYWRVFGWYNIFLPYMYYWLIALFCIIGYLGVMPYFLDKPKRALLIRGQEGRILTIFLISVITLWGSMLVTFLKYPVVSNGRFLFPTIGPFAILLVFGINKFLTIKKLNTGLIILSGTLVNLAILAFIIIPKYY